MWKSLSDRNLAAWVFGVAMRLRETAEDGELGPLSRYSVWVKIMQVSCRPGMKLLR